MIWQPIEKSVFLAIIACSFAIMMRPPRVRSWPPQTLRYKVAFRSCRHVPRASSFYPQKGCADHLLSCMKGIRQRRCDLSSLKPAHRSGQQSTRIQPVCARKALEYRPQSGLAPAPRHRNHDRAKTQLPLSHLQPRHRPPAFVLHQQFSIRSGDNAPNRKCVDPPVGKCGHVCIT